MIRNETLRNYADTLKAAGFTIYAPGGTWDYFTYSRTVDGVERFGTVQLGHFGGFSHSMPLRPSRENGSGMWVEGVPDSTPDQGDPSGPDPLTVEAAENVTQSVNYNPLVGIQHNHRPWTADAHEVY